MLHSKLKIMKAELKVLALEIRRLKSTRKSCKHGYVSNLGWTQSEYRTIHIARCILRGRTLEQIEPKLKEPNLYEHQRVRKNAFELVAKITKEVNEQQIEVSNGT